MDICTHVLHAIEKLSNVLRTPDIVDSQLSHLYVAHKSVVDFLTLQTCISKQCKHLTYFLYQNNLFEEIVLIIIIIF